jgi:hypothetical protein
MAHVDTNAHTSDVDNELFEEWKNSKRKQFKAGTRKSFIKAYNVYEDLLSKNTHIKSKNENLSMATNPMLQARSGGSNKTPSASSTENTWRLFSQQSIKKISLDKKNKRNI